MTTLAVYDTNDGNSAPVARASGRARRAVGTGEVRAIAAVRDFPSDLDLLAIGAAGRTLRISGGVRRLLAILPDQTLQEVSVAAFDTRPPASVFVAGLAARRTERARCRTGACILTAPESFLEESSDLCRDELAREAAWVRQLANHKAGAFAPSPAAR